MQPYHMGTKKAVHLALRGCTQSLLKNVQPHVRPLGIAEPHIQPTLTWGCAGEVGLS